jgi:hypothetical protein
VSDASSAEDVEAFLGHMEQVLGTAPRAEMRAHFAAGDLSVRLGRLRRAMTAHSMYGTPAGMAKTVKRLDQRTRIDGFHVLNSWDHQAHRFTEEITPVLLLDFFVRTQVEDPDPDVTVAILIDYYFLHLLALGVSRVWDTDDPGAAMSRITSLLEALSGEGGSGHHFVSNAETLLIYALSQFHPEEQAYERVIERVSLLPDEHRLTFAVSSASVLGAHLRWGFWLMYERDVVRMRNDNQGDYPWLLWTAATLLRAWEEEVQAGRDASSEGDAAGTSRRSRILNGLLQVLAPDPWILTGPTPTWMASLPGLHSEVKSLLQSHGGGLLEALEEIRPAKDRYSPLSLHFNFPHNALVAAVTLALMESIPSPLHLDVLFQGARVEDGGASQEHFARVLMAFSGGSLDRLGHRGAMLIAYDPLSAMRSYSMMTRTITKALSTE